MRIHASWLALCLTLTLGCPSGPEPSTPALEGSEEPGVASSPTDPGSDPVADPAGEPAGEPGTELAGDPVAATSAAPAEDPVADPNSDPTPSVSTCGAEAESVRFTRQNGIPQADCITDNVCVARDPTGPVYNSAREEEAERNGCDTASPVGVEFAPGRCLGNTGTFVSFRKALECISPSEVRNHPLCMHLTEDDLWYDVTWHSFTGGGAGGGFSYTRTLVGGDPCGVGATCSAEGGVVACACPDGSEGDPESFCL
jgi:hypothetical protein